EFIEAHRLSKRADLLYNISVCYERLGRWDDAIASLQQYLTERPEAPDRAVIESRISNYEQRRDQEKARLAAAPPVAPTPALTISTDVLLAVGGATLATGIVLFIVEARKKPAPSSHAWLSPSPGGLQVQF